MKALPDISVVAAMIGDGSRAAMLTALMDGRSLPASLLAYWAGISPQTASAHLAKLVEARLVAMESQGRERCYRLAGSDVARALEALMVIAPPARAPRVPPSEDPAVFRQARLCYDHVAGKLGVELLDALLRRRLLARNDVEFTVTKKGVRWLGEFGIDLAGARKQRRNFARQCMDLTVRRHHLAGALGASLAKRLIELGWIEREPEGRALNITKAGRKGFTDSLALKIEQDGQGRANTAE